MIIDTGEFHAITGQLARGDGQAIRTAFRIGWDAGIRHARVLDVLAAPAGRHTRPRDRRGLRLVEGSRR